MSLYTYTGYKALVGHIAKVAAAIRAKKGLTMRQLARLVKVQPSSYFRFERQFRTLDEENLMRVINYLGIEVLFSINAKEDTGSRLLEELRVLYTCPRCLHRFDKPKDKTFIEK